MLPENINYNAINAVEQLDTEPQAEQPQASPVSPETEDSYTTEAPSDVPNEPSATELLPADIASLFKPRTPLPTAVSETHPAEAARRIGEDINDLARANEEKASASERRFEDRRSYLADAKLAALTLNDLLQEGTPEEKKKAYESYAKERGMAALDKGSMYAGNLIVGMLLLNTKSQDQKIKSYA